MNHQGVFTPDLRVRFVEKTSAEVGEGTPFPAQASLDQIAQIYFRAKTAEWQGGEITAFWDDSDAAVYPDSKSVIVAPSSPPTPGTTNHQFAVDAYNSLMWYYTRGYCTPDPVPLFSEGYMGESYPAYDVSYRRDIDIDERAMWLPEFTDSPTVCTTAFSWDSADLSSAASDAPVLQGYGQTIPYGSPYYYQMPFSVLFSGEIAVVLSAPGASFWGAGNAYYLGVRVRTANAASAYTLTGWYGFDGLDTVSATFLNPLHCGNYVMRLANDTDVSCKLYTEMWIGEDSAGTVGNLIHKVTEWWPYAKDSPAVPVWNSATGEKL